MWKMPNHRTFALTAWNGKGKVTRRERFLTERDGDSVGAAGQTDRAAVLKAGRGRPAGTGEDAADLVFAAMVQFVGSAGRRRDLRPRVDAPVCTGRAGEEVVPDESTIMRFRHLLEQHGLTLLARSR